MIATGLLWYDDDTRRPLAQKIADAAERFRERVGYEPTACQLNPTLIPPAPSTSADATPARRPRASAPSISLRLLPDTHLRPNYFFVGVEAGEPAIRVPGWHDEADGDTAPAARSAAKRPPTTIASARAATRQHAASARVARSVPPAKTATATLAAPQGAADLRPAPTPATATRAPGKHSPAPAAPAAPATTSRSPAKTATAAPPSMDTQGKPARKPARPATAAAPAPAPARPAPIRKSVKAAKTATAPTDRSAGEERPVKSPRARATGTPPAPIAPVSLTRRAVAAAPAKPAGKRQHASSRVAASTAMPPAQPSLWASDAPPTHPARKRRTA